MKKSNLIIVCDFKMGVPFCNVFSPLFQDNEFLEEERIYLSGLRHAPYA